MSALRPDALQTRPDGPQTPATGPDAQPSQIIDPEPLGPAQRLATFALCVWAGMSLGDYLENWDASEDPEPAPTPDEWAMAEHLETHLVDAIAAYTTAHPEALG